MLEWIVRILDKDEEWLMVVQTQNYIDSVEALQDAIVSVAQCIYVYEKPFQKTVTFADVAFTNWEHTYWKQCGILDIFRLAEDVSLEYGTSLSTGEEIEWLP